MGRRPLPGDRRLSRPSLGRPRGGVSAWQRGRDRGPRRGRGGADPPDPGCADVGRGSRGGPRAGTRGRPPRCRRLPPRRTTAGPGRSGPTRRVVGRTRGGGGDRARRPAATRELAPTEAPAGRLGGMVRRVHSSGSAGEGLARVARGRRVRTGAAGGGAHSRGGDGGRRAGLAGLRRIEPRPRRPGAVAARGHRLARGEPRRHHRRAHVRRRGGASARCVSHRRAEPGHRHRWSGPDDRCRRGARLAGPPAPSGRGAGRAGRVGDAVARDARSDGGTAGHGPAAVAPVPAVVDPLGRDHRRWRAGLDESCRAPHRCRDGADRCGARRLRSAEPGGNAARCVAARPQRTPGRAGGGHRPRAPHRRPGVRRSGTPAGGRRRRPRPSSCGAGDRAGVR